VYWRSHEDRRRRSESSNTQCAGEDTDDVLTASFYRHRRRVVGAAVPPGAVLRDPNYIAVGSCPFPYTPTKPLGIPQIWSFCFWGGVWAQAFGCVREIFPARVPLLSLRLPVRHRRAGGWCLWFVVFPLRGQPVAAGLDPGRMLTQLIIHGCYGLGVGVCCSVQGRCASFHREPAWTVINCVAYAGGLRRADVDLDQACPADTSGDFLWVGLP